MCVQKKIRKHAFDCWVLWEENMMSQLVLDYNWDVDKGAGSKCSTSEAPVCANQDMSAGEVGVLIKTAQLREFV